jgi:SOS regulatory protein LexA
MNDPQKEFGLFLKNIRKEKKLSIRQLQDLSGVSNAYISQLENGKRGIPTPDIIKKIHEPLGVSYDELMEKAGHISAITRFELHPETIKAMGSYDVLEELFTNAAEIFINSVTEPNGKLKDEYREFVLREASELYGDLDLVETFNNENIQYLYQIFEHMSFDEKIRFLNEVIKDFVDRDISLEEVFEKEKSKISILNVPVMGYIAAGNPIFADEHIEEWTEVPNMWNLKGKDVFILKVKGDSMIGSRIYEGDKVVVKIQQEVENGEIAVVNVNGEEATLKRVKKTENGQVILFPDNPRYDPLFITNENARIIGKVIQVMFEP